MASNGQPRTTAGELIASVHAAPTEAHEEIDMDTGLLWITLLAASTATGDTVAMRHPPEKHQIVVSATRTAKDPVQVPNTVSVVRGDELRQRATRTLAEALQDVTGLDTGEGSDNGMRLPNLGMWGLKEFDALLVT